MATENSIYCGPCESRHARNEASIWCPNCEEGLCKGCSEYHKVSKALRQHQTISIQTFRSLPLFVRNISQTCLTHDAAIELYCGVHQVPCCGTCISNEHSECPGVTSLKKVVVGVKESSFCQSIEERIRAKEDFLENIKSDREKNLVRLKEQKRLLLDEVKAKRENINIHLNTLEEKINQEIDLELKGIKKISEQMQTMLSKWNENKMHFQNIFENATELQLYMGLRFLEQELAIDNNTLASCLENDYMKDIGSSMVFSNEIETIESTVKSMGTVKIYKSSNFNKVLSLSQFAQLQKPEKPMFENIQLKQLKTLEIPARPKKKYVNICCCIWLSDGRIILADNNLKNTSGELFVFKKEGTFEKSIPCSARPFGMAFIGGNKLAVSFFDENRIRIFELDNLMFSTDLCEGHQFFGLSSNESYLVSAAWNTGMVFMDNNGKFLKIFPGNEKDYQYIHLKKEKIFYSDSNNHILYALSQNGEEIWNCKFDEMKGPRSICTDNYGNVFVAACDSSNIVLLTPDGKECKVMLNSADGIYEPKAVYFHSSDSLLVVSNRNGTTFTYRVIYQ